MRHMQWAIGVGSNKGNRERHIKDAARLCAQEAGMQFNGQAVLIDNPAQDAPFGDAAYLNTVFIIESDLGAHQILHRLQNIECQLGRVRTVYHGARTIDLDLLLCREHCIINSPVLQIPHPSMHVRDFVMKPLIDCVPEWYHPLEKCSLSSIYQRLCIQTYAQSQSEPYTQSQSHEQ